MMRKFLDFIYAWLFYSYKLSRGATNANFYKRTLPRSNHLLPHQNNDGLYYQFTCYSFGGYTANPVTTRL